MTYTLHFDGSCWPNPGGIAAYGYILAEKGNFPIREEHAVCGTGAAMSNNVAEFEGAFNGLRDFAALPAHEGDEITVLGDSNLVAQIMSGNWRASSDKLYYPSFCKLRSLVYDLEQRNVAVSFKWIPREENQECDKLSKAHNN